MDNSTYDEPTVDFEETKTKSAKMSGGKRFLIAVIVTITGIFGYLYIGARNYCLEEIKYHPAGTDQRNPQLNREVNTEGYYSYGGYYSRKDFKTQKEALKYCVNARIFESL